MENAFFFEQYVPDILGRLRCFDAMGLFDLAEGKRVLVVGCGTGYFSHLLAARAAHLTGVDVATENVQRCREVVSEGEFLVADGRELPLEAAAFDLVFCSEVLEHTGDYRAGLAEIDRVLAPGGHMLISFPIRPVLPTTRLIFDSVEGFCTWYFGSDHPMTHKELLDLKTVSRQLRRGGYDIVTATGTRNTLATCMGESMILLEKLIRMARKGGRGRSDQLAAHVDYCETWMMKVWKTVGLPVAKGVLRADALLDGRDSSCGIILARKT